MLGTSIKVAPNEKKGFSTSILISFFAFIVLQNCNSLKYPQGTRILWCWVFNKLFSWIYDSNGVSVVYTLPNKPIHI